MSYDKFYDQPIPIWGRRIFRSGLIMAVLFGLILGGLWYIDPSPRWQDAFGIIQYGVLVPVLLLIGYAASHSDMLHPDDEHGFVGAFNRFAERWGNWIGVAFFLVPLVLSILSLYDRSMHQYSAGFLSWIGSGVIWSQYAYRLRRRRLWQPNG